MKASIVGRVTVPDVLRLAGVTTVQRGNRTCFTCPSHEDHRPSAFIVGERGWTCFVCGAHGGVFDLCIALGLAHDRASAAQLLEEEFP